MREIVDVNVDVNAELQSSPETDGIYLSIRS